MKSFRFNQKTGEFELNVKEYIDPSSIRILKHIAEKGYGDMEEIEQLFTEINEDDRHQLFHDATYQLSDLEMIEFKEKQNVCIKVNKKDYSKSKWEEKRGYFLTSIGKAFAHSLGFVREQ